MRYINPISLILPYITFTQATLTQNFINKAASYKHNKLIRINKYSENSQLIDQILDNNAIIQDVLLHNENINEDYVDVAVRYYQEFKLYEEFGLEYEVLNDDIENMIYNSLPSYMRNVNNILTPYQASFNYSTYNTYDNTRKWMNDLSNQHSWISKELVGETYEKRTVEALKLSKNSNNKKAIIFNTGIHAREWIGPAHMLYIVKMIIDDVENDREIVNFLNDMDIYIIPNSNADGYEFSWTDDRMWRKTRSNNGYDPCFKQGHEIGVDPNRNFPVHWSDPVGGSDNPCTDTFRGPKPASEICVQNIISYVSKTAEKYENVAFLDVHSYSQLFMYPYGYSVKDAVNSAELDLIAKNVVAAVENTFGMKYEYGSISTTIYEAAGGSVDTIMDDLGISCNFAPELRDKGRYGFLLPDDQIPDVALEMYNGYKVLMAFMQAGYCKKF